MTTIVERLQDLGEDNWALYKRAREMLNNGEDIIELAIGEPDIPTPGYIIESLQRGLANGRTAYSDSAGEAHLRDALAQRYSRPGTAAIRPAEILCFPGAQTALYAALRCVAGEGNTVVVGDPMYATYEPAITACGARALPVLLSPARGFRLDPADVAAAVRADTRAILLNTPHNPTGAVLSSDDIRQLGKIAQAHDLWIISDEVYEELVFGEATSASPLDDPELRERTIVISSISKSHAAPGLRSGWLVAPQAFCEAALPLSEAMLFGNQPFIADTTAEIVAAPSPVAPGMSERFARRAGTLATRLHEDTELRVHVPEAGMFALIDVSRTGMPGLAYAESLLLDGGVAVMPGCSFGQSLAAWVRISLTKDDSQFVEACNRIVAHYRWLQRTEATAAPRG